MRRVLFVAGCLSLLAGRAIAEDSPLDVTLRRNVLAAITKRDARAFAHEVSEQPLRVYHVWFESPACAKEFGGKVQVPAKRLPALVACLSKLGLEDGPDGTFVHAPGVAVVPLIYRGKLAGLSGVAVDPKAPTVTDAMLAANLVAGSLDVAPDPATRATIESTKDTATVWLEACVDPSGKIEKISAVRKTPERSVAYARTVEAAAAGWTFRPFKRAGKPIRVCLQRQYEYPR